MPGRGVDAALLGGDLRLTMGGEPTFVSDKDPDGAEWTIDALGPTKRAEAGALIRRLMALWSPGAVLQYGAGKHYPGEQTPRWALHATWRLDGEPVWTDLSLLADPDAVGGRCGCRGGGGVRAGPGRNAAGRPGLCDAGL